MKVLFDTNVVLDLILDRAPFANDAAKLFADVEHGKILGLLGATTVTTIHYLVTKSLGPTKSVRVVEDLLHLFDIAHVNRLTLESALHLKFPDFEDAVLHEAAAHSGAQIITTRDISGFKHATVAVYSPKELLRIIAKTAPY